MRPDAMRLDIVLSSASFGTTEQTQVGEEDREFTVDVPVTVQIQGQFGEVDPLTVEDARALLPKLAYIFEGLVKEHHAVKQAQAQRAALIRQATEQAARQAAAVEDSHEE